MYNACLLTDGATRRVARRALGLATLVVCSTLGACGGDSKSKPALSPGATDAAAGDSSQADGAAGVTSETGNQADADAHAVTNGGTSDAGAIMSGEAGDATTSGSESPR